MKIILFGASGMVGQGVLRECLLDTQITNILVIGRSSIGKTDPKIQEIIHKDFTQFTDIEESLKNYDACFFCLGVSSAGMSESAYAHVTYDYTLAAAQTLSKLNPGMTFTYVTGMGTDSTEKGRRMWARVKGKTENALLRLPFKAAYMFRPGIIEPMHGVKSKTPLYQMLYVILSPFISLLTKFFPNYITTTEQIGRAMIKTAKQGAPKPILETIDINAL